MSLWYLCQNDHMTVVCMTVPFFIKKKNHHFSSKHFWKRSSQDPCVVEANYFGVCYEMCFTNGSTVKPVLTDKHKKYYSISQYFNLARFEPIQANIIVAINAMKATQSNCDWHLVHWVCSPELMCMLHAARSPRTRLWVSPSARHYQEFPPALGDWGFSSVLLHHWHRPYQGNLTYNYSQNFNCLFSYLPFWTSLI